MPFERLAGAVGAFSELERIWGPAIPDADPVYLICGNGVASGWLAYQMAWAGRSVRALTDGMPAWNAAGRPVVAGDG